jgi:stage II sporulation protein D (peptidoglycan lytic transglycosylase)
MTRKALFIIALILVLAASRAESSMIKVLILDDVFRNIPNKDDNLEVMGKLKGDLLVDGTHYQGKIEIWKDSAGLYLINELPLEEYVKHVVSAEVGMNWDLEALKTQAVIARTYALYQKSINNNTNYDLTSTVLDQVYKGNVVDAKISYAVAQTKGEVLTYDGKLIEAFYHSTCGGETEDPQEVFGKNYPYLRPVKSKCDLSPYWSWDREIPLEEIGRALGVSGIKDISIQSYTSTGRVRVLKVLYDKGVLTVKATDLRKMLGWKRLPSTKFTFTRKGDELVFEGKGYGHGVGLCQWGALEMAREGKSYREILSFYYPGTTIQLYEDR